MYDVIYFNIWSDIICTAAKLLHGTSTQIFASILPLAILLYQKGKNNMLF